MQKIKIFGVLGAMLLLCALAGSVGLAQDTSSLEALDNELTSLQEEYDQLSQTMVEAKDLSLETMVRMAGFKEEVLYRLGLWRAEMAKGLMSTIEARGLKTSIEELKVEVSLAKEMAASARIQADQALSETRELAKQTQEKTDMILAKLDDTIRRVRNLEKGLGGKKGIKFKSASAYETKAKNIYQVKEGDSLWRIAGSKDVYGDSDKWRKIYEANKDKIGATGLIYPGQKLVIPAE